MMRELDQRAKDAATAMKITAQDLLRFGIIDTIIAEPIGGAHRLPEKAVDTVGDTVENVLAPLLALSPDELRNQRSEKFLAIGRKI